MKRNVKIISLMFLSLFAVSMFASCQKEKDDNLMLLAGLALSKKEVYDGSFVTEWDTTKTATSFHVSDANQIKLPLDSGGTYDFTVDWGDGSSDLITSYDQPEVTHNYATGGVYTVTIEGTIKGFGFSNLTGSMDNEKLLRVLHWGNGILHNNGYQFAHCVNLTEFPATGAPDLRSITNMIGMFYVDTNFDSPIGNWDVSAVTDMTYMFTGAAKFNSSLAGWDVSSVTSMNSMFLSATTFNQSLNSWDVSSVKDMSMMFSTATGFNQPMSNWDVSSVTNMNSMFSAAKSFNQPLNTWNVSSVTDMGGMFNSANKFNQPLNAWNVAGVLDMSGMFAFASSFNRPLDGWDVSKVTNMNGMLYNAAYFDQDLSSWCVSSLSPEPTNFDTGSPIDGTTKAPVWGSCP